MNWEIKEFFCGPLSITIKWVTWFSWIFLMFVEKEGG